MSGTIGRPYERSDTLPVPTVSPKPVELMDSQSSAFPLTGSFCGHRVQAERATTVGLGMSINSFNDTPQRVLERFSVLPWTESLVELLRITWKHMERTVVPFKGRSAARTGTTFTHGDPIIATGLSEPPSLTIQRTDEI